MLNLNPLDAEQMIMYLQLLSLNDKIQQFDLLFLYDITTEFSNSP
jgi:hypothetical protein